MSRFRAPGEPGPYGRAMEHICGFDGGDSAAPPCGAPAVFHHWGGAPPDTRHDWVMLACELHFEAARRMSWDWHPISPVCNVPGTMWQNKSIQGEGFCYWPEAESAIHEAAAAHQTVPAN